MSTPFDGLGVWVFDFGGEGTPLTEADADNYKGDKVDWIAVKVADFIGDTYTGGGEEVIKDIQAANKAGIATIPWFFAEAHGPALSEQVAITVAAAGGVPKGSRIIVDAESTLNVKELGEALDGYVWACTTWGNPYTHPGAPSVGQLCDVGCTALLPQCYGAAWKMSASAALEYMRTSFGAIAVPNLIPLLPVYDNTDVANFAGLVKANGGKGVSAWRHGAPQSPTTVANANVWWEAPPAPLPVPPAPEPVPTPVPPAAIQITVLDTI
ncbi:MAG: hypothetical protein ACRDFB_06450, partial [Rhabdochlamydiaceae bacterium]